MQDYIKENPRPDFDNNINRKDFFNKQHKAKTDYILSLGLEEYFNISLEEVYYEIEELDFF